MKTKTIVSLCWPLLWSILYACSPPGNTPVQVPDFSKDLSEANVNFLIELNKAKDQFLNSLTPEEKTQLWSKDQKTISTLFLESEAFQDQAFLRAQDSFIQILRSIPMIESEAHSVLARSTIQYYQAERLEARATHTAGKVIGRATPCYDQWESDVTQATIAFGTCAATTWESGFGPAICGAGYAASIAIAEIDYQNCIENTYP